MLTVLGRYDEAERYLQKAHAASESGSAGMSQAMRDDTQEALIELYTAWEKPEQAARYR